LSFAALDDALMSADPHQGPGFERVRIANLAAPENVVAEGRVFHDTINKIKQKFKK